MRARPDRTPLVTVAAVLAALAAVCTSSCECVSVDPEAVFGCDPNGLCAAGLTCNAERLCVLMDGAADAGAARDGGAADAGTGSLDASSPGDSGRSPDAALAPDGATPVPRDAGAIPADSGIPDAGPCVGQCAGRCSGDDGCGGQCPDNCVAPKTCGGGPEGFTDQCGCTPQCAPSCGQADGCNGLCPISVELDATMCSRLGKYCGRFTGADICGTIRDAHCGGCANPTPACRNSTCGQCLTFDDCTSQFAICSMGTAFQGQCVAGCSAACPAGMGSCVNGVCRCSGDGSCTSPRTNTCSLNSSICVCGALPDACPSGTACIGGACE
jgi:hypothetical protein